MHELEETGKNMGTDQTKTRAENATAPSQVISAAVANSATKTTQDGKRYCTLAGQYGCNSEFRDKKQNPQGGKRYCTLAGQYGCSSEFL